MTGAGSPTTSPCGCGGFSFPTESCNGAGLPEISYRTGDFVSFRYRLLAPQPGETELTAWRPGAVGDLAVQMMEWWAYLGDILSFYNERIANEAYLGTAALPESVNHLVQLLGYRPKPALGAKGVLAALLTPSARSLVTLSAGLQIQSKPGPGQQPQIFQVDQPTVVGSPDVVVADVFASNQPLLDASGATLWLAGKSTSIKPNDRYLLIHATAISTQTITDYAWIEVTGATPGGDPLGKAVTKVSFTVVGGAIAAGAQAANYVLLRSQQSSPLWPYPNSPPPLTAAGMDLAGVARGVSAGSLILIDVPDGAAKAAAAAAAATAAADSFFAISAAAEGAVTAAIALQGQPLLSLPVFQLAATEMEALATSAAAAGATNVATAATTAAAKLATQNSAGALDAATAGIAAATTLRTAAAALAAQGKANPATVASAIGLVPTPVVAQSYSEVVWYANGQGPTPPAGNPSNPPSPIAVPHAEVGFAPALAGNWWPFIGPLVTARWGWVSVGQLTPVLTSTDLTYTGGSAILVPAPGSAAFPKLPSAALVEDPTGAAASATATAAASPATGATLSNILQPSGSALSLASPIDVFFNLVGVSCGKTVPAEILGSGNPSVAGQDFTLSKSPVTYFFDPASVSGPNFSSTVAVSVNGVQWREVQSFYGQPANAQVFVLREDDQGHTHVSFGDGVNGALLATGTNNVTATYRFGAGAQAPTPETLTVVLTPTPGLKGVRNPIPPTGGGDPDQPSQLSALAPRSVLTFNRAVSLDDYAAIAQTASGVTQAIANYAFDPWSQRPVVVLWIAGDSNAPAAAAAALAGTQMPSQRVVIETASAIDSILSLTYLRDTRYADAAVRSGLMAALADPATGLLAPGNVGIGQPIYQSQIAQVCLAVDGVSAIQTVSLAPAPTRAQPRFVRFFFRPLPKLTLNGCSGLSFSPGPGAYFSVPNDSAHIVLNGSAAS